MLLRTRMHGDARPHLGHFRWYLLSIIATASCARTDLLAIECGPGSEAEFCPAIACIDTADCPAGLLCWQNVCREETWYNLGDSAMGTWLAPTDGASTGGISLNVGHSSSPSLAMNAQGYPVVAWQDDSSGVLQIYARRFDGTAWVDVAPSSASGAGISNTAGGAQTPVLAVDAGDRPVVAWGVRAPDNVYVARFDGSAWVEVSAGSASGQGISGNAGGWSVDKPSLAFDEGSHAIVAWRCTPPGTWAICASRFDGAAWGEIGAGSVIGNGIVEGSPASAISPPALAVDSSGRPTVVWGHAPSTGAFAVDVYVRGFSTVTWDDVGNESSTAGGISGTGTVSLFSEPALVARGTETAVVVWVEGGDDTEIYVKHLEDTGWRELGNGSASNGGVSNTGSVGGDPSVAVDAAGHPLVAWADYSQGNGEIYVRRFDGSRWRELGAGSASAGGISNSAADSSQPSLAVAGSRACIAWTEADAGGASEIVLRCADLP